MEKNSPQNYLATLVREWRLKREMSQQDLSDLISVNQSAVAKIERGERGVSYELLLEIADALVIPWNLLRPESHSPRQKTLAGLRDLIGANELWTSSLYQMKRALETATTARQDLEQVPEVDQEIVESARFAERTLKDRTAETSMKGIALTRIRLMSLEEKLAKEESDE